MTINCNIDTGMHNVDNITHWTFNTATYMYSMYEDSSLHSTLNEKICIMEPVFTERVDFW